MQSQQQPQQQSQLQSQSQSQQRQTIYQSLPQFLEQQPILLQQQNSNNNESILQQSQNQQSFIPPLLSSSSPLHPLNRTISNSPTYATISNLQNNNQQQLYSNTSFSSSQTPKTSMNFHDSIINQSSSMLNEPVYFKVPKFPNSPPQHSKQMIKSKKHRNHHHVNNKINKYQYEKEKENIITNIKYF